MSFGLGQLGQLEEVLDTGTGGGETVITGFDPLAGSDLHVCPTGMTWDGAMCKAATPSPLPVPHPPPHPLPSTNSFSGWLQTSTNILGVNLPNWLLAGVGITTAIVLAKGKR